MVFAFTIHDMVEGKLWSLLLPFMIRLKADHGLCFYHS